VDDVPAVKADHELSMVPRDGRVPRRGCAGPGRNRQRREAQDRRILGIDAEPATPDRVHDPVHIAKESAVRIAALRLPYRGAGPVPVDRVEPAAMHVEVCACLLTFVDGGEQAEPQAIGKRRWWVVGEYLVEPPADERGPGRIVERAQASPVLMWSVSGAGVEQGRHRRLNSGSGVELLLQSREGAFRDAHLDEPVVAYGPFVMNTMEEIREAIADVNRGGFGPVPD